MNQQEMDQRLIQLAKRIGSENASRLLSVLGKDKEFMNAVETPVGQELVKDIVINLENIIGLILNEKADDKDLADMRAYRNILSRWNKRIASYNKNQDTFIKKSS